MTEIQTPNLIFTPSMPTDSPDFIALEQDPDVMRYLNGGRPVNQQQADPAATFLMPRGTEPYVWTARLKTDAVFVGWFCLYPESATTAELGYRLHRTQWGKGFATEGTSALINWGFAHGGYDRIFASTLVGNRASRRVLEKLQMAYVRTIHINWPNPFPGSEEGEMEYEVLRSGWKSHVLDFDEYWTPGKPSK